MGIFAVSLLAVLALQPGVEPQQGGERIYPLKDLQTVTIKANDKKITAWIMDSASKRMEGLMLVRDKDMKMSQGMIFVFKSEEPQSFWMRNTLIPLDIIYISARGVVRNVVRGKPMTETPLPSDGPAQYVLELKAGGAKAYGIRRGLMLFFPKLTAQD